MKNKIYKIALCAIVLLGACKKGDDLYINPNAPSVITPGLALTALEVNNFMNTEGDLARVSSILAQQFAGAGAQYTALQNYDLAENDYNNQWITLYSGAMYNAKLMIDNYGAKDPYYGGMAKVLMAINLGIATDLWGDVPYSDAFQGGKYIFISKYDKQEQVYLSIQSLLDGAIADFGKPVSANADKPGTDDLIYGGVIANWKAAAWTLKARYANRLSQKDPQGSATKVLTYLANGMTTQDQNMLNIHNDNSPNQWADYENNRGGNMVANKTFVDALQSNNDPRLSYYFSPADDAGNFVGADITQEQINTAASIIGPFFNADQNYPSVTVYEARFLEAEAKSRLGQDASAALNNAIKASVAYVTQGKNDGSSIAIYNQSTANLTAIMTEKWKAMCGHIEAYNDYRRTGLPVLQPRPGSVGAKLNVIPKRLPTPGIERTSNPNAVSIPLTQPVWWAGGN